MLGGFGFGWLFFRIFGINVMRLPLRLLLYSYYCWSLAAIPNRTSFFRRTKSVRIAGNFSSGRNQLAVSQWTTQSTTSQPTKSISSIILTLGNTKHRESGIKCKVYGWQRIILCAFIWCLLRNIQEHDIKRTRIYYCKGARRSAWYHQYGVGSKMTKAFRHLTLYVPIIPNIRSDPASSGLLGHCNQNELSQNVSSNLFSNVKAPGLKPFWPQIDGKFNGCHLVVYLSYGIHKGDLGYDLNSSQALKPNSPLLMENLTNIKMDAWSRRAVFNILKHLGTVSLKK